jgi:hypothetical protein
MDQRGRLKWLFPDLIQPSSSREDGREPSHRQSSVADLHQHSRFYEGSIKTDLRGADFSA